MTSPIVLLALIGVLYAAGVYLILERSLTRVLLGILVLGNATNVLVIVAGGRAGAPPLVGTAPEAEMSDALVQALVLTAIVITLGVTAFLLALIHRTWTLEREDDLTEDVEDRSVRRRLERGEQEDEEELDTTGCENTSDTDPEDPDDQDAGSAPAPARATTAAGEATR
ncbi:Na(+)/H(+) antiporter subunit C [Actinomycetospora lutea]|uniref:Na(+)/H(+) antiporter subunit C n=1 Tax=Actinomycetospora lutea TaxID=663604 RepID=UPI0023669D68|nr:Na(+)/H(+) antiporter subunit C [Actinomycetospora lutea]MDD7938178.1 Na(+)/H(+) antiporter subunit C [Actinomycetospora lutea]